MQLEFVTNACVVIRLADERSILVDPWIGGSAFYGSWYNFPPLTGASRERYASAAPHFIYISHIHPDHLHGPSLARYSRETPILIGKMKNDHLRRSIAGLGFRDIRELSLGDAQDLDGLSLSILPDFGSSGDGYADDTGYAMDSSLYLEDSDGTSLLHGVDNCMQPADARSLRERYGKIDVAILPYAGASFFPHAFFEYDEARKIEKRDAVKADRLGLFIEIVRQLQPSFCIPAAGSYVMGGRIAAFSRYLHQATPDEIDDAFARAAILHTELRQLCTGDVLDARTGAVHRNPDAPYRRYTSEERAAFAEDELASRSLSQDAVTLPDDLAVPWTRLLEKARKNLRAAQERLDVFPSVDVELTIRSGRNVSLPGNEPLCFRFALDDGRPRESTRAERMCVRFRLEASLLLMLLTGAAIWNNAEIGALVECAREPDLHDPTVHSLMSYFAL